jgi:ABC-2 type transport system ATP-binding protein
MSKASDAVLEVRGLEKTFRIGFFRKRVEAVRGIDFTVTPGEIFGLLGPNGAGKTTTIKMILRLIFPDRGTIRLFGGQELDRAAMARVGYLPENPYIYQYLRPMEFLDLCGRLVGMPADARTKRALELLEQLNLTHALDRPIGKFSKGMMQRVGLAQALLHDPELLILDEPMSGLDPIGRKEVRDVLLEQRRKSKTLIFTSHILSDVEMLCDRVVILHGGKVTARGTMGELLRDRERRIEIDLDGVDDALATELAPFVSALGGAGPHRTAVVRGEEQVGPVLNAALRGGARVRSVVPHRETLENLFLRDALDAPLDKPSPDNAGPDGRGSDGPSPDGSTRGTGA